MTFLGADNRPVDHVGGIVGIRINGVVADLVEEGSVADLQKARSAPAIPSSDGQCAEYCRSLCFLDGPAADLFERRYGVTNRRHRGRRGLRSYLEGAPDLVEYHLVATEQDGSLDDVLQLADVSGERMLQQGR